MVPAVALIYFSFYFVSIKYKEMNKTSDLLYASKITKISTDLIHSLQIERGLSAGFIAVEDKKPYLKKLLKRRGMSDTVYKTFLSVIKPLDMADYKKKTIFYKNINYITTILKEWHDIANIRNLVTKSSIDFKEEIAYYSNIIKNLMDIVYTLSSPYSNYNGNSMDVYTLQNLEENAGLERAYIYNSILSRNYSVKRVKDILRLIANQENYKSNFLKNATITDLSFYNRFITNEAEKDINLYRKLFFDKKLKEKDAIRWFGTSTNRIDQYHRLSTKIIKNYLQNVKNIHQNAKNALITTFILWFLAIVAFLILVKFLKQLLENEEKMMEELRIASYAFNSHEAMTITDPNGVIIKVNKAFTKITGYEPKEVIGKNPKVLKSFKHPEEFYKEMWRALHTKGYWSDEIYNKRKNGEIFIERLSITAIKNEKGITTHYIAHFFDISELKKARDEALHQAKHDYLTKLPNRSYLIEKLKEEFIRAKRHNFLDAFLFIDLDKFKAVNDNYGHLIGDNLLISATKRLKTCVREDDYVARISGDEFCILLVDLGRDIQKASEISQDIAEKILKELRKPYLIDKNEILIGASIGIKIFPKDNDDIDEVVKSADIAMYEAKKDKQKKIFFYDKLIGEKIQKLSMLKKEIEEAFKNNQFIFYFQPKVDSKNMEIAGAEVLVRWQHPIEGIVYPGAFIDIIKSMNKISLITYLAIENACRYIKNSDKSYKGTFSINITANELLSPAFIEKAMSIINSFNINPSYIEFEILEDELIKNFDTVIENMKKLKEYGIKFSIDDFGSGYSSIRYLQKLPVDKLKIDRYFIANYNEKSNQELIKMVANIAKTFGLDLVVEGIEKKEQLDFLNSIGVYKVQGFYFSRAIEAKEFANLQL